MGGGGKGGTTTTQTMQIPPEVLARYNAVNARAETVAQTPYQKYSNDPNAFVAPLTQTQQAGIQNTNTMAGAAQPYYGAAAALTAAGAGSANPQGLNVGQYYNPYTQAVAAPTLEALQQQQATERSNLMNPQTARSFGGDRSGIVAANLARQQALGTAQAMNPIYKQAYDQALATAGQQQGVGLAAQQANLQRLGQAGAQFGQLGSGAQAAGLAGAQAQLAAGSTEQQTGQAGLQALYNQFQQQQAYPFQIAQFLSNIATGTGALSGNTTTGTTQGGGGFFSDERLKENVEQVGKTNDGQNIYRYNYKGDPRSQIGLIAQEVAQDHPEAVGQKDGYLTVDYRDATNDAVREHKAGGGDIGTSAYDISAPSAMMGGSPVSPEVLAGLAPKPMVGLGGLPIAPGATSPGAAGILAPKATGLSPGSIEGAQAQLSTLRGADMGKSQSGSDYFDQQKQQLQDFLSAHGASSQGGLVSGPGEYARGGYAEGGYMNPALQFYGAQGGKSGLGAGGPYGAQLTPAQVQMMRAAELPRQQQQRSGIEQANQIANMAVRGNEAWRARPDFLRSEADIAARAQTAASNDAIEKKNIAWADQYAKDNSGRARGGLIAREHHAGLGPVGGSMPYGSISEENALGEALTAPMQQHEMMQPGKMGKPAPQPSGAQQLGQMAGQAKGLFDKGKNVYDFAAKKLAGDTTGLAGQTVNVGSATATPLAEATTGAASAVTPGVEAGIAAAAPAVEGLAAAAPIAEGLAGAAGAAEAGAGLAGAAGAAEAGAGLAGLAGAAEGAGLVGSLASGAALAGEGIMAALPFLAFLSDKRSKHDIESVGELNDGQPVYRFKYNGDDETRMGLMAQDVEQDHPEAVKGLGGVKMVDYKRATDDAARQRHSNGERVLDVDQNGDPIPMVDDAAPRGDRMNFAPDEARLSGLAARPVPPRDIPDNVTARAPVTREEPSRLASFASDVGDFASGLGKKAADADSNFWVPAIAGIGSMLASPNKTLAAAIGSGLVGGTGAYTALQKQNADLMKQRLEMAKGMFTGPEIINGKKMYNNTYTGKWVSEEEMLRQRGLFTGTGRLGADTPVSVPSAPAGGTTDVAKSVIDQPAPTLQPRPAPTVEAAPRPRPVETPVAEVVPPVSGEKAPAGVDKVSLEAAVRRDPTVFQDLPENRRPAYLEREADRLEADAEKYQAQSQEATRRAALIPENTAGVTRQNAEAARLDALAKSRLDEAAKKREAAQTLYNNAIDLKYEEAKKSMQARIESENTLVEVADPETGATMLRPRSALLGKPVAPGAGSPPGADAGTPPAGAMKSEPENVKNMRNKIAEEELKMADDFRRREVASSRVNGLLDILTKYETGKFAEQKADIIGKLNGLGIRVDPTVSADPAKFEIFMKGAIKNVFDDLPGGKILLAEIAGLSKANANPGMQAEANAKILGDAKAAINYENKYTLDYARWRKANPNAYSPFDTTEFNEQWLKQNKLDDFKKEASRNIGYVGQKLPTKLSDAVNGQAYYVPSEKRTLYFDKTHKNADGSFGHFTDIDPLAKEATQ
jgi:hypothetical protein